MTQLHVQYMLNNMTCYIWKGGDRLEALQENQKKLTRAINQNKIRQVRRSTVYQFGYMSPWDYKQALELDEQNGNSKWYDATKVAMDQIKEYEVSKDMGRAKIDNRSKQPSNAPIGYQKIRVDISTQNKTC